MIDNVLFSYLSILLNNIVGHKSNQQSDSLYSWNTHTFAFQRLTREYRDATLKSVSNGGHYHKHVSHCKSIYSLYSIWLPLPRYTQHVTFNLIQQLVQSVPICEKKIGYDLAIVFICRVGHRANDRLQLEMIKVNGNID